MRAAVIADPRTDTSRGTHPDTGPVFMRASSGERGDRTGSAGENCLLLRAISKTYGGEHALHPTDLEVKNGEFLTILGPSGSGKTTILRLVGGFARASSGRIVLDGEDITELPSSKRPCNTVFQDYALFPHKTAADNVGYGLMVRGIPAQKTAAKVSEALRFVGLEGMARKYPSQLSGGQQQRVALARSLICAPRVLLLDEPLSALDADMRRQMQHFLKRIQKEIRTTFIFVTHDQEEAITLSDRIAVMNQGRLEQLGTPSEIYYRPATHFVATFLGDNNIMEATVLTNGALSLPVGPVERPVFHGQGAQAFWAAIRPERISLPKEPVSGSINIPAKVVDVAFSGALTTLRISPIDTPDHTFMVKLTSCRGTEEFTTGSSVLAAFDPADLSFFPRKPS
ncbi:ABC transporter ATP-binding protein [Mesorhizobium comanense]|uniref:ABC transporter ATP-binding protein n=1 Tax=Mesorhizobium comanense TaxID=2502215 RepID=UPI001E49A495|nr:ABC transporter ATP-binding protein [Mesorhizobium comanense]